MTNTQYIQHATEAAQTFCAVIANFERGRLSLCEMNEAIFRTVARHKYSEPYIRIAAEAIRANSSRAFMAAVTEDIRTAAEA